MKKIIRIASVIALASASLLYVGCTKDFSADIAKTNQDVAALNQKIENLDATVQTINSTVANLQTTKADLSAVNALGDKVTTAEGKITTLGGKIDDLDGKLGQTKTDLLAAIATAKQEAKQEAVDEATTKAAQELSAAKSELLGVIGDVNDRVDSLAAQTLVDEAAIKALGKDVDTLKTRVDELEDRIATLEGRVDALSARITSIVAVPSTSPEFNRFYIKDTVGAPKEYKDTAFFAATFAVTPKTAVNSIKPEDLKVNFKEGLTRGSGAGIDTTCKVSKVVADVAKGEITVFAGYVPKSDAKSAHNYSLYYSLAFAGEDDAEAEYEVNSEFVKAHAYKKSDVVTIANNAKVVEVAEDGSFTELTGFILKNLTDTLAYNGEEGYDFGKLLTTDKITVAFKLNGNLISANYFGEIVGTKINVKIDTNVPPSFPEDSCLYVTSNGTKLGQNVAGNRVGQSAFISANTLDVNGVKVPDTGMFIYESHIIGAKTVEYTLPEATEPWTYTSWDKVSRTVTITGCEDVHNVVPDTGITSVNKIFRIYKDPGTGVNIAVTNAARNKAAKDTVYNVAFKNTADIFKYEPDTVNFTINWKYTLEGRPADETIVLANVDTLANDYTKELKLAIDSKIVDKTFAKFDAAYDKAIDTVAVKNAIKGAEVELNSVVFDGKKVNAGLNTEKTAVVLPAHSKAGAYSVILHKVVFGIKYTYTYTITIDWKAKYELHATPYVSGGEAFVDADTTDGVYTLKNMDIAKYLQVFNHDTLATDIPSEYTVKFKVELEDSAKFDNGVDDIEIGEVVAPESATINGGFLDECKLEWGEYKGRAVKVTAYLANDKDTVHTYTFTLRYEQPIRSFSAGTQEVKRVAGVNAKAVLSKSFEVKGLYHGDKNLIVDTTGAWINKTNYYGCEIGYDLDHAVFKVDGVETTFREGTDYEFAYGTKKAPVGPEAAVITFIGDNNNKNIEATIPVVLGYKYDYNHVEAYWDNVVIKVVNE